VSKVCSSFSVRSYRQSVRVAVHRSCNQRALSSTASPISGGQLGKTLKPATQFTQFDHRIRATFQPQLLGKLSSIAGHVHMQVTDLVT